MVNINSLQENEGLIIHPYIAKIHDNLVELYKDGVNYIFEENEGLTLEEQKWLSSKDIGNISSPGCNDRRLGIYPIIRDTFSLLEEGKLNIFNSGELIEQLLGGETSKLHYVFRWGIFCFTDEEQEIMKELVNKGDFSEESWNEFLDENKLIKGRVIGDGSVYEHQMAQSKVIEKYSKYDLLNVIPGSCNSDEEGTLFGIQDYIKLQILGLIHDNGEFIKGDVSYDFKHLESTRGHELDSGISIIKSLGLEKNLEDKVIETYNIDFDENNILKPLFSLYEKMSYMNGAMKTYNTIGTKEEVKKSIDLIYNVLKNQIVPMVKVAMGEGIYFPLRSMQVFLDVNMINIDNMFKLIYDKSYIPENTNDELNFKLAVETWVKYKGEAFI